MNTRLSAESATTIFVPCDFSTQRDTPYQIQLYYVAEDSVFTIEVLEGEPE